MSWVLSSLLLLFTCNAWSFEYKIEETSLLHPSVLDSYQLTQVFARKGYQSVSDVNLTSAGFLFDRAFVSNRWEKSLLLKAGLKAPAGLEGRVIDEPSLGLKAFHFNFEGTP